MCTRVVSFRLVLWCSLAVPTLSWRYGQLRLASVQRHWLATVQVLAHWQTSCCSTNTKRLPCCCHLLNNFCLCQIFPNFTMDLEMSPKIAPFCGGPDCSLYVVRLVSFPIPNGISIVSAVLAWLKLTATTNSHTQRPQNIDNNRPHLMRCGLAVDV